ncbi:hypothetical protein T261_4285 [Streptomyces lydicus]|nr:hypothetical protein T261_4285 [Streptomyces lydicus]
MSAQPLGHAGFAHWLRAHATPLTGLDPDAPLDDLEPLRDLIGDARVVAVGENAHFIREFALARERLVRFLVTRCGFTAVAFEYGFSEGFALDAWVQGDGGDTELAQHAPAAVPFGMGAVLSRLRHHNRTAQQHPVRFAGVDIPAAGGSLLPALAPVADYLCEVDPEALPLIEKAVKQAERCAGESGAVSGPAWARLTTAEQDALTAALSCLLIRFRAVAPLYADRSGRPAYDLAVRRLEAACHGDYSVRHLAKLTAGGELTPADTSGREIYMADSVSWHLEHTAPQGRIVLVAHNAHIQKTPFSVGGRVIGLPMGHHLQRAFGEDYFALGLTGLDGHSADMHLDESARFGFTVEEKPLPSPEPGSIEAAFAEAGPGPILAGLRTAPRPVSGQPAFPDRMLHQGCYLPTPVLDAFDALLAVPTISVGDDLDL